MAKTNAEERKIDIGLHYTHTVNIFNYSYKFSSDESAFASTKIVLLQSTKARYKFYIQSSYCIYTNIINSKLTTSTLYEALYVLNIDQMITDQNIYLPLHEYT